MSAEISSSRDDVKISKIAKIEENLNFFNVDDPKSFLYFCKQTSEVNFQSKNFQISSGINKLGKLMLYIQ